jgi:hypothetical protein
MISISLCSESGLFMNADKRIWNFEGEKQPPPLPLMINIFAFKNSESWTVLAKEVDQQLYRQWPKELNRKHNIKTQLRTSPL